MKLEEAIKHCEEIAEEQEEKAKEYKHNQDNLVRLYHSLDAPYGEDYSKSNECLECANEHRQLSEWLKELKAYKEADEKTNPCDRCQEFDCYGCVYKEG